MTYAFYPPMNKSAIKTVIRTTVQRMQGFFAQRLNLNKSALWTMDPLGDVGVSPYLVFTGASLPLIHIG